MHSSMPEHPFNQAKPKKKHRVVFIGRREVHAHGLEYNLWNDLYHHSMRTSWTQFFLGVAVIFFIINTSFAFFYFINSGSIANARPDSFLDHFFFSIETLATVGYGDMYPKTVYGHTIATIEIFLGMACLAIMTGLIFARFSRPQARLLFAKHPVIGPYDGKTYLMFRIANERTNSVTDARAKLWLVRTERTADGTFRRYYPLPLERDENPLFALSWLVLHRIDERSMLHGLDMATLKAGDTNFILSITGYDENAAQDIHVRHTYPHDSLRWDHLFVDMIDSSEAPKLFIDYTKFHDIRPAK